MSIPSKQNLHGDNRRQAGYHYEEVAVQYYQRLGFEILERNWQASHREIDIIIQNQTTLIFVEVKGGRTELMGHPAYRVDERKRRFLIEAAQTYLDTHNTGKRDLQFDVLVVIRTAAGEKIERFANAFGTD